MNESTVCLMKCSGGSAERYQQSPSCSSELKVVSVMLGLGRNECRLKS